MSAPLYPGTKQDRIEQDCIPEPNSGCWLWTALLDKAGYGRLSWHRKGYYAHRLSWEAFIGPIPTGLFVLHKCDNPPCVNPEHLFIGTQQDNMDDKIRKGRHGFGYKAKLTEKQVLEIRQSDLNNTQLGIALNVSDSIISRIRTGKIWKHI